MDYTFRPIDRWPGEQTRSRRHAPFRSSYSKTMQLLDRELIAVNARAVVIQLALTEGDIRRDGRPRADSRPAYPGVILAFESTKTGPVRMPCDKFTDWESNLRAIALSLEALRKVDRYGVTRRAEQYRGWQALPPAGDKSEVEKAAVKLVTLSTGSAGDVSKVMTNPEAYTLVYRLAVKRWHPDATGGHLEPQWAEAQAAAAVLSRHHGVA
jgi:hypothetical protein